MREPQRGSVEVGGLPIAYADWPADPAAPPGRPVLLVHATGFHGRVWDTVARALPGRRVVAPDLRGHGRSGLPPAAEWSGDWSGFVDDVEGVLHALGLRDVVGVGHSLGGHVVLRAACRVPERFAALLLLDPVVFGGGPPSEAARSHVPSGPGATAFIAKRRNAWEGPAEMVAHFRDRPPYRDWAPGILEDYAEHGLAPAPDGPGFVLACPPAFEASVYARGSSGAAALPEGVEALSMPVRVVRGRPRVPGEQTVSFTTSPARPDLASLLPHGEDVPQPERSHFFPMEDPAFVVAQLLDLDAR